MSYPLMNIHEQGATIRFHHAIHSHSLCAITSRGVISKTSRPLKMAPMHAPFIPFVAHYRQLGDV
jgi:hypothetical protein